MKGFPQEHQMNLCRVPAGCGLFPEPSDVDTSPWFIDLQASSVSTKPSSTSAALPQHVSFHVRGTETSSRQPCTNLQRHLRVQTHIIESWNDRVTEWFGLEPSHSSKSRRSTPEFTECLAPRQGGLQDPIHQKSLNLCQAAV